MDYERFVFEQPLYGSVNVLRVGETLVDTGHLAPACRADVADAVADGPLAGVERVLLTHPHSDHVGGSLTIPALTELPHVTVEGVPERLRSYDEYLRETHDQLERRGAGIDADEDRMQSAYFPLAEYAGDEIEFERVLTDGDVAAVGPYDLEVVATPGHAADHMALWHEPSGTLLSADLVSANGHFMYGPVDADVGDYLDSLERVRALDPDVLVPGHGPPMDDAVGRIDDAIEKADRALTGLREAVAEAGGPVSTAALAREVFGATDATVRFLNLVACEYLEYLDAQGVVDLEYRPDGAVAMPA
ncbi:MAG: MBL fold metallo-hydrolase [Haloarculaceae archaeon]